MIFTIYERALAVADLNKKPIGEVLREMSLPPITSGAMKKAVGTYLIKINLIKDKQAALDNLLKTIDDYTSSNNSVIAEASSVAAQAITFRTNLELSILESRLKMLEIEAVNIKKMTASEFLNKYGA